MNALQLENLVAQIFAMKALDQRDALLKSREKFQRIEQLILSRAEQEVVISMIAQAIYEIDLVLNYHG
jgi:hypothetical protein